MLSLFGIFKKKKDTKLEPVTQKQRYQCPFYGFHMAMGMLMDSSGNQCALITDSYSPCQMKIGDQTPDWSKCPYNNDENREALETIAKESSIFPEEFCPERVRSWRGIPFQDWQEYIMGQETNEQ